jgi:hypothetical protein
MQRMLSDLIGDEVDSEAEYRIRGDYLFSDSLDDWSDDELEDLHERSKHYPLNVPPKERLLPYADWLYFEETPAHRDFIEFIRNKTGNDAEDEASHKLLVGELCSVLRQWAPMQECFDILESFEIKLRDLKETKQVSRLILQMSNNTKIWGNSGFTPNELNAHKQAGGANKSAGGKVGRNDPCPCGSGKKYKHCCGKNRE